MEDNDFNVYQPSNSSLVAEAMGRIIEKTNNIYKTIKEEWQAEENLREFLKKQGYARF